MSDAADRLRELLETPWIRSRVLVHLAPALPGSVLGEAIEAARSLEAESRRGERLSAPALAAIAARAVELADVWALTQVAAHVPAESIDAAVEIAREGRYPPLLAELAPRVAETGSPAVAVALLRESANRAGTSYDIERGLIAIASRLDEALASEALDFALELRDPIQSISALAEVLGPDDAYRAIIAIPAPPLETLARLLPRLEQPDRDVAVGELLERAARAGDVEAVVVLAERVPAGERSPAVAAALRAIERDTRRLPYRAADTAVRIVAVAGPEQARAAELAYARIAELAPRHRGAMCVRLAAALAPGEQRDRALDSALEFAPEAGEPWRVMADAAELAEPGPHRRRLAELAQQEVFGIRPETERGDALSEFYERFPELLAPPSPAYAPGLTVMETADAILADVPPVERTAVLAEVLDSFRQSEIAHGVDGGPAEAPPVPEHHAFEPPPAASLPPVPPASAAPPVERPARAARGPRPEPVVSTGFASLEDPDRPLRPSLPLRGRRRHVFWLEIGEPIHGSIERTPVGLPHDLPEQAQLTVALFAVSGDVSVASPASGQLRLLSDGSATVVAPAAEIGARGRRLYFLVDVAVASGTVALRCSIYFRQVLLQSRRVEVRVAPVRIPRRRALQSELDYVLTHKLTTPTLDRVGEHTVSLMLNGDNGTHALQVVAADGGAPIIQEATFEGGELEDLVRQTRGALRQAAWKSEEPWAPGQRYQYAGQPDRGRLTTDLVRLAVRGWRLYDACINRLAGGYDASVALEERLRRPARIQVANRRHASLLLPAALFFDQPLDTGLPADRISLCPEFVAALDSGQELHSLACFEGNCPSRGDVSVVCPSGFWGFRHSLGLPLSLGGEPENGEAAAFEIDYAGAPEMSVAVSTDPQFTGRTEHEAHLRQLVPALRYADSRDEALRLLREAPGHVTYFYCHGGLTSTNVPYLTVGPVGAPGIASDVFRALRIRWVQPRPLVFLNGCHTTALDPGQALNFPSRLVENAGAAGVIGTEITNFEPLACAFAEECLGRFLGGEPIGDAIRGARLRLLADGNPLGLIYVPFVLPSVRLREARA